MTMFFNANAPLRNKYRVVVERQPESHKTDFQVGIYGPNGLVSVPIKYMDYKDAVRYAENFRFAFEAGLREATAQVTKVLFHSNMHVETIFPDEDLMQKEIR